MYTLGRIGFLGVALLLGWLIVSQWTAPRGGAAIPGARQGEPTAAEVQAKGLQKASSPQHLAPAAPTWSYSDEQDAMGRGTVKYAEIQSTNTVTFGWPYGGPQRATLGLRIHPTCGKSLILFLPKAHFLCHTFDDSCRVTVRVDDGKPQTFRASGPDDHAVSTLFIRGYDVLVPQLKTARTLRIEANFYQEGRRVLEFAVVGLTWETPAKAPQKKSSKAQAPTTAPTLATPPAEVSVSIK